MLEQNVAQRFLLQYPHTKDWMKTFRIRVHGHETHHRNKADPEYGLEMIRPEFQYGRVRLPGKQHGYGQTKRSEGHFLTGRRDALKLVDELTSYSLTSGASKYDDQVMACWIYLHKVRSLRKPDPADMPRLHSYVPRWANRRPKMLAG